MLKGLDANVLVRWLADDGEDHAELVVISEALSDRAADFHVNLVALAETVWTLGYSYKVPRAGIAGAIRALLGHPRLRIERPDLVAAALSAYEKGGAGFSDHLIGALDAAAGCSTTLTFDKRAAKGPFFTLLA